MVKHKDPVFEGAKKGSVRDSNADSEPPFRVCDYYAVIKKPTKTLKPKSREKQKSHVENPPGFCVIDHKQSLVNAVSITIQICMPCFWLANSSPPWGELWERFWKYKCKIQRPRRSRKNGECSRGFVMAWQSGSRMQIPRLEEVSEMAVN